MTPREKVERYIAITESQPVSDLDELLRCDAIEVEDAECLIAFVPMAFAYAILAPSRVRLPSEFLVQDFDTGSSARGRLDEEPIFVAALAVAGEMLTADQTKQRALDIAACSAEMSAVSELRRDGSSLKDIVLTEPVLLRLPIKHIKRRVNRPRWKLWK